MTTTKTSPTTPDTPRGLIPLPHPAARVLIAAGAIGTIASTYMSWTWTSDFPGDLTYYGSPAGLQILDLVAGVLTLLFALTRWNIRGLTWLNPAGATAPVFLAAAAAFTVSWFSALAIAIDLGGLVNLDPGAYIAAAASLVALLGALALPSPGNTAKAWVSKPDNIPRQANSPPGANASSSPPPPASASSPSPTASASTPTPAKPSSASCCSSSSAPGP